MLINSSYFTGERFIPNTGNTSPNAPTYGGAVPNKSDKLQEFIDTYEYDFLNDALTPKIYEEFISFVNPDGALDPSIPEKYRQLIEGEVYELNDETYRWKGLRYTVGTTKKSLIADYVFFWFLKDGFQFFNTTGISESKSANANTVSPTLKLSKAWRDFFRQYQRYDYQNDQSYHYRGYGVGSSFGSTIYSTRNGIVIDYQSNRRSKVVSMIEYINDKNQQDSENYPDWQPVITENTNSYGI